MTEAQDRRKVLRSIERSLFRSGTQTAPRDYLEIERLMWKTLCWRDHYNEFGATEAAGMLYSLEKTLRFQTVVLPGWIVESLSDQAIGQRGALKLVGCQVQLTDGCETVARQGATRPLAVATATIAGVLHAEAPRSRRVRLRGRVVPEVFGLPA